VLLKALPGLWGPKASYGGVEVPGVFTAETVEKVVDFILDEGPSMTLPQLEGIAGGGTTPGQIIQRNLTITVWNDGRIWSEGLNNYQGNLYGFIRNLIDPDFYEFFITSIPVGDDLPQVELVIRPKPYDDPSMEFAPVREEPGIRWGDLRTQVDRDPDHVFTEAEVLTEALGVSDTDTFSYYECVSRYDLIGNEQSRLEGLYYPAVDLWQLKRFGLRKYESTLTLLAADVSGKALGQTADESDLHAQVAEFRNRLLNWNRLGDYLESGTVTVIGRDKLRGGDPCMFPYMYPHIGSQRGLRFYCPSVSHQWTSGGSYTCTLNLVRGYNQGVIDAVAALIAADAPADNPNHYALV
jgi:hypothetical protein